MLNNIMPLVLYGELETEAIENAIKTRLEVLSVVPTLEAAIEYLTLQQIVAREPFKPAEVSSEHA
jgi:hypothetical protein